MADSQLQSFVTEADFAEALAAVPAPLQRESSAVVHAVTVPRALARAVDDLRAKVALLYEDISYDSNPTEDIWGLAMLAYQRLAEDEQSSFWLARRRLIHLLLHCLGSWENKDDWERDVEVLLQEELEA